MTARDSMESILLNPYPPRECAVTSELVESFARVRRDAPERPLVYQPALDRVWTAEQLAELVGLIGGALDERSIAPGSLIVSTLGNRPAALAALLACVARKLPLMPVDATTPIPEIVNVAARFEARAFLMPDDQAMAGLEHVPVPAASIALWTAREGDDLPTPHAGAAVLKLTSGSTGAPRATLTTEAALVADGRRLIEGMGIAPADLQIASIPMSHAYGLGNLVMPLLLQGTAIVLRAAFVPQQLPVDARRFKPRLFPGVPFMFDHFVAHPPLGGWPPSLTTLISAGAPITHETVTHYKHQFGVKIGAFYGTSETGGITYDDSADSPPAGFVGRALPRVSIRLCPDPAAAPPVGRVLVMSDSLIERYAGESEVPSLVDGGFLTGDLGTLDADGSLRLVGRVSSFVNVGGHKVQPDEVEAVLRTRPDIADARVIGVPAPKRGEELVACIVTCGVPPSLLDLRRWCADRLAPHKIPRAFVVAPAIPLTERGKTDWRGLRALIASRLDAASDPGMLQ